MRTILLISTALLLTGCSALGQLENRVACTPDGKTMLYASMYGPVGVVSRVSEQDTKALCQAK